MLEKLEDVDNSHAKLWSQMLVCHVSGMSKVQLYTSLDAELSPCELSKLREYVYLCGTGKPIQYVLGEAPFRYLTLKTAAGVLIPRPETEVLVSEVLRLLPPAKKRVARDSLIGERDGVLALEAQTLTGEGVGEAPSANVQSAEINKESTNERLLVADLCTGSGCIACALATERDDIDVIATDISPAALALAKENVLGCEASAHAKVLLGNLGEPIEQMCPQLMGTFDAVVSNPPYVPSGILCDIPRNVSCFEPALALDGGKDGLDIYRDILTWAPRALKHGGVLATELHETCLDDARALACGAGFHDVKITRDLAGKERVLSAIWRGVA